jgi:hypothetical protein
MGEDGRAVAFQMLVEAQAPRARPRSTVRRSVACALIARNWSS